MCTGISLLPAGTTSRCRYAPARAVIQFSNGKRAKGAWPQLTVGLSRRRPAHLVEDTRERRQDRRRGQSKAHAEQYVQAWRAEDDDSRGPASWTQNKAQLVQHTEARLWDDLAFIPRKRTAPMPIENLHDLFVHTLKDVLYAERKILKALPKMERKATDPKLKAALAAHRDQTEDHVTRLEDVFDSLGKAARGAKCDAMVGLVEEAEGLMAEIDDNETMDVALISLAQAVEHYEIARYGTLVVWAQQLGLSDAAALLKTTLDEEYGADKSLSKLAEARLNAAAA